MKVDSRFSAIILGLALFAMFFGSGNLIYPLYIGQLSQASWPVVTAGFLIAAVFLPFLGVVAMVLYKGSYDDFFSILGKKMGFLLSALLLTVWIPLGSAPRCMTLTYASINSYFDAAPPLWAFSLVYSALVFFVITTRIGVLDILGKFITPLLLGCIGVVCWKGFSVSSTLPTPESVDTSFFVKGLVEGYNTMDLIASFFFSASIIHLLQKSGNSTSKTLALVVKASVVGVLLLGVVYVCLISLAAHYSPELANIPKDQMLAFISKITLGPTWSIVAILAITLACFSTSIALILAYTDFLHDEVLQGRNHPNTSILIALVITFIMSLFGLEGITWVTAPVLKVCYPVLLCLIVINIFKALGERKSGQKAAQSALD